MSLQRFTTGVYHALIRFPLTSGPACSAKVSSDLEPLLHLVDQITSCVFRHPAEQDSQPIAILIIKQVIPYRIRGGTCCHGVSTPKILSLADSSNHTPRWSEPSPPFQAFTQTTTSKIGAKSGGVCLPPIIFA
jgi:hypothetical protein